MIDVKELRIGNWVICEKTQIYVTGQVIQQVDEHEMNITPIPLSEEWLLRFGFVEKTEHNSINGSFWTGMLGEIPIRFYKPNDVAISVADRKRYVHYVHQLQNLYFALTGNELTVKP